MSDIIIRSFKPKDSKEIYKLWVKTLKDTFQNELIAKEDEFEDISETYLNSGGDFLIAEKNGEIVGTIAYITKGESAKLKRLYVDKNSQGLGIGQKLLDEIEKRVKEKGIKEIILSSYKQMIRAQKFYLKNGFKITKTIGDRIYMKKDLGS